jgi:hypothetical protein
MNELEILILFGLNFKESNVVQAGPCLRFLFCAVISFCNLLLFYLCFNEVNCCYAWLLIKQRK